MPRTIGGDLVRFGLPVEVEVGIGQASLIQSFCGAPTAPSQHAMSVADSAGPSELRGKELLPVAQ